MCCTRSRRGSSTDDAELRCGEMGFSFVAVMACTTRLVGLCSDELSVCRCRSVGRPQLNMRRISSFKDLRTTPVNPYTHAFNKPCPIQQVSHRHELPTITVANLQRCKYDMTQNRSKIRLSSDRIQYSVDGWRGPALRPQLSKRTATSASYNTLTMTRMAG